MTSLTNLIPALPILIGCLILAIGFWTANEGNRVMSYDTWKTTEPEPVASLSCRRVADKIADLNSEINWNIRRLGNLVLSDEDRQQTEDLIMDLREERESLKRCLNVD